MKKAKKTAKSSTSWSIEGWTEQQRKAEVEILQDKLEEAEDDIQQLTEYNRELLERNQELLERIKLREQSDRNKFWKDTCIALASSDKGYYAKFMVGRADELLEAYDSRFNKKPEKKPKKENGRRLELS